MSELAIEDRRLRGMDRRRRPTPMLSRYTFFGRRRSYRRTGEAVNAYVDRLGAGITVSMLAVLVLSLLDAVFTLLYLQNGGGEMNPLMERAIEMGVAPFLTVKLGLTFGGIFFLCLHKNFRYVKPLITCVVSLYVALMGYHFYLMAHYL